jgi:GAF domain-containing protein/anti-sigma regulatory factor (Ser/Thr protein kinase)
MSTAGSEQDLARMVEQLTRELSEAHQREAAAAEVLNVISRSNFQVQPVFDSIVQSGLKLFSGAAITIAVPDGDLVKAVAVAEPDPARAAALWRRFPVPLTREYINGVAILDCRSVDIADVEQAPPELAAGARNVRDGGNRAIAVMPMKRGDVAIGALSVVRLAPGPLSDRQIAILKTFADQAVIAIENARLLEEVQARTAELSDALERQTAISEVLKVSSSSSGELQPVFQAVLSNAVRLCGAKFGTLFLCEGDAYRCVAMHNAPPALIESRRREPIVRPGPWSSLVRSSKTKLPVQIPDVTADQGYLDRDPVRIDMLQLGRYRSVLTVPMLKHNEVIGAFNIWRQEPELFMDKQIEPLRTFADQAVIAIENARLVTELRESLEYQTVTSEVLSIISRSPAQVQPVLDAIVENAARLCHAEYAFVYKLENGNFHLVASNNAEAEHAKYVARHPPNLDRGSVAGRAALDCVTVHVIDALADPQYTRSDSQKLGRYRTLLGVPLLRDGVPVGVLVLLRTKVAPFTDKQIAFVTAFADQAVIATHNVGLFQEVQTRTRELKQSLEYQTATGEVLNIISRSPTELQPVLDVIVETAARLCLADLAYIFKLEAGKFHIAAASNADEEHVRYLARHPPSLERGSLTGRVALDRTTIHVPDVVTDPEYTRWDSQKRSNYRSLLGVPLLRRGDPVGVIMLVRWAVMPFTDKQIELVATFADQAVIAIENARLFEEVQARNRDLMALGEVGRAVSSTLHLKVVLKTIVDRAVDLSASDAGSIFYYRQEVGRFELGETLGLEDGVVARYRELDIAAGQTGLGEAIRNRQPLQVPDVMRRASNALRDAALEAGLHAALIVPLLGGEDALGALVLQRRRTGEFPPSVINLMQSFADQSAIALENARLFEEIARKSREVEIVSQHKSQFVANMSHELRTPLAAILGYAELMQEGFYEPLGQKSLDALSRIRSNGKHLLGLINTVLDIAKIESGQFTLNMTEYAIESVVETVRSATESLAQNKKLALKTQVAKSLPIGLGDEQRLTQVLLNLVGNAIKFTDTGEVRVTAKAVNGHFAVSVADTGPGIPSEHQTRIFDQFHQVDSSNTNAKGGTGLGLAIAKQIVEMHGGRIWVESTLGKGSTFQMELPTRAEFRKSSLSNRILVVEDQENLRGDVSHSGH